MTRNSIGSHKLLHNPIGVLAAGCAVAGLLLGCSKSYEPSTPPNINLAMSLRSAVASGGESSAGSSGPVVMAEPTGWATLKGRFTLTGDPPERQRLNITGGDGAVCAPGGKPVLSERLVVGADGGIKDILIFCTTKLSPDEPYTHSSAKPGDGGEVEFDQKKCVFLSHMFAMKTGQTLKILNSDPVGHNTKIDGTPINQIVGAGGFVTYTPKEEWKKPYAVSCSIHPWMSANLIVRDNGYFAVTDESGNFEIPNLPAGIELEFRTWQEAGTISDVQIAGQPVSKGRFTITLPPEGQEIDVALDGSLFE